VPRRKAFSTREKGRGLKLGGRLDHLAGYRPEGKGGKGRERGPSDPGKRDDPTGSKGVAALSLKSRPTFIRKGSQLPGEKKGGRSGTLSVFIPISRGRLFRREEKKKGVGWVGGGGVGGWVGFFFWGGGVFFFWGGGGGGWGCCVGGGGCGGGLPSLSLAE